MLKLCDQIAEALTHDAYDVILLYVRDPELVAMDKLVEAAHKKILVSF